MRIALLLVMVYDLYFRGPFMGPNEANAPLLIDADAVLSFPLIFQRIKSVAGRHLQIVKNCRPVQPHADSPPARKNGSRPTLN